MKSKVLLLFSLIIVSVLSAQKKSNEQLEFKIENDKLVLVDKYYTSGFFLTYRRDLESSFIFKKKDDNKLQLNIALGNETFTPTNLQSTDTRDFDRPYAGWLYSKLEVGRIKNNSALFLGIEAGVTGEESLSGSLQTWAHELFNIEVPPWTQEIEFKFLINLKANYIANKRLGKSHAIQYNVESSIGTKDIYLSNGINYFFGHFNDFNHSNRNNFVDQSDSKEFFGFINFGHKLVLHNTLIQGSLDYNDESFTTNNTLNVIQFKFGGVLKSKKNIFKLIYNFNTKETPNSSSHSFGTLSYARVF